MRSDYRTEYGKYVIFDMKRTSWIIDKNSQDTIKGSTFKGKNHKENVRIFLNNLAIFG